MASPSPARRMLSIWLPRLPTDRARRDRPGLASDAPLVLVGDVAGRAVITAVDAWADAAGAQAGMGLADARAAIPALIHASHEPVADTACLELLADWAGRYTPVVALDGPDGLLLDITGCAHLFGGEEAMLRDATARLQALGFAAVAGLADTALGAATLARGGRGSRIAAMGGIRAALKDLPPAALRPHPDALAVLARLGFRRIGDLYPLPSAEIARRFGRDLVTRLDRALGLAPDPLSARPPPRPNRVRLAFPDPIGLAEDIAAGLERLLAHLCRRLGERGLGARNLVLDCHRADGTRERLAVGMARPSREPAHLARLFAEKLGGIDPGFGIDLMILTAETVERVDAASAQGDFAPAAQLTAQRREDPRLAALWDRLSARLGPRRLVRLSALDSHLPDRCQATRPILGDGAGDDAAAPSWPTTGPARPATLLPRPEHLRVGEAGPDPERPPASLIWRGRVHRVARVHGPERISPDWWRAAPGWAAGARDYWQVEDVEGQRFWIFRDGVDARTPHRPDLADPAAEGWMLAGLFA